MAFPSSEGVMLLRLRGWGWGEVWGRGAVLSELLPGSQGW